MSPSVGGATPGKQEGGGRGGCSEESVEEHRVRSPLLESLRIAVFTWGYFLTILAIFVMPSQQRALCLCWCDDVVLVVVLREGLDWIVFHGDHVTPRTPVTNLLPHLPPHQTQQL